MSLGAHRSHLALTLGGCFGAGSLYGWSGYLPAVRAQFDADNASASMVFSLALVTFTFGVLLGPTLLAPVRPHLRLPAVAGLATFALSAAVSSQAFPVFVVAYGVCFGFASGVLYNLAVSLASTSGNPTLLVPVSVAAFGLGGAVFGPVNVWLTNAGWGLWSAVPALTWLAVATVAGLFLKPRSTTTAMPQTLTLLKVRPNKTLAILWVIFAAGSSSGLIVLGFAAQFLSLGTDGAGLTGLAVFLVAIGNTLGRLTSAMTAGRFGAAHGIAGALSVSIFALAGLFFTTAPIAVVAFLSLVAFAYGQLAATTPLLVKSHVTGAAFSGSFGWVFTGWGAAGLLGPWTAGWLLDATGTLRPSLVVCIALASLSLWLVLCFAQGEPAEEEC